MKPNTYIIHTQNYLTSNGWRIKSIKHNNNLVFLKITDGENIRLVLVSPTAGGTVTVKHLHFLLKLQEQVEADTVAVATQGDYSGDAEDLIEGENIERFSVESDNPLANKFDSVPNGEIRAYLPKASRRLSSIQFVSRREVIGGGLGVLGLIGAASAFNNNIFAAIFGANGPEEITRQYAVGFLEQDKEQVNDLLYPESPINKITQEEISSSIQEYKITNVKRLNPKEYVESRYLPDNGSTSQRTTEQFISSEQKAYQQKQNELNVSEYTRVVVEVTVNGDQRTVMHEVVKDNGEWHIYNHDASATLGT